MNFKFWRSKKEKEELLKKERKNEVINSKNYKNLMIRVMGLIDKQGSGRENYSLKNQYE